MALDALALRVIAAFSADQVDYLLLKGPVTQAWLYCGPVSHTYSDVDLLIAPRDEDRASEVLRALNFVDHHARGLNLYTPPNERAWVGREGVVDLHTGLAGVPMHRREAAWRRFSAGRETFMLHGREVSIMGVSARAMHLALHAAQRLSGPKAEMDLERALCALPAEVWHDAAVLARELDAEAAFSAGLESVPRGRVMLRDEIRLVPAATTSSVLQRRGASAEALAFARLEGLSRRQQGRMLSDWFKLTDASVSAVRVVHLRAAALARLPRGASQWLSARSEARRRARNGVR